MSSLRLLLESGRSFLPLARSGRATSMFTSTEILMPHSDMT